MEDIKLYCIEPRKNAVIEFYKSENIEIDKKVEDYFKKIEDFSKGCKDVTDFESKFSNSDLGKKYTELFIIDNNENESSSIVGDIGKKIADDVYHGARRQVRQEAYDKIRDIPVVGEILTAKQHIDFFSRFKKKKDDE